MNNIKLILKFIMIFIAALILIIGCIELLMLYRGNFEYSMKIQARFKELGPVYSSMPVYYKGFKIGKTKKIEPTDDYKYTLVDIILYPKNLAMPENIEAKVKKFDNGKNYIELEYPKMPSDKILSDKNVIEGKTAADIQSFMSAQIESGVFSSITGNMNKSLTSIEKTSDELNGLFKDIRAIIAENRPYIKSSFKNSSEALENLNDITAKFNSAIDEKKVKKSASDVHQTTGNIVDTTSVILDITETASTIAKDLGKTIEKIDATILEAQQSVKNVNSITSGLCELMGQRFAGMRLMFGKPVKNPKCSKHCSR